MNAPQTQAQVEGFIDKYDQAIAAQIRAARAIMRARLPGALELVYDNYNALAIAYGPTERLADVICSIAAYPRWISLFLAHGATLDDPDGLLKGEGSRIRHVVLETADRLQSAGVAALLDQALRRARPQLDPAQPFRTVVKSISARQRPRRPSEK
ncbi:MAG: hypothetical protein C0481_20655 [Phenylobacterium sp.]|uniref:hypothetical protein n=1 Tax=Phenylobacterium sp. TaxID=1871053 RepID=UPI0025FF8156|nr:hypothetical protein [Phenylobacterium sp.]MBA4014278.1 hypothetical protein [Phenylobacterium sp.]